MEINPIKSLKGTITVAPDKSISHRAVMLASIANGKSLVSNFLMGDDCLATIDCFRKLKVPIEVKEKKVYVNGKGKYGLRPPDYSSISFPSFCSSSVRSIIIGSLSSIIDSLSVTASSLPSPI